MFMVTSWFAKPVYSEKGNSSILLLSTKLMRVVCGIRLAFQAERCRFEPCSPLQVYLSKALSGCVHGLGPCGPGSNPGRETNDQWKVNQAGPDSVLKTEGVRKRIEFDSTSLPPNLPL